MEEKRPKNKLTIDELIERVGSCGFYQIRTQTIFLLFMLPITYQVLIMYYVGDNPPWRCKEGSRKCRVKGEVTSNDGKIFQKRCKMDRDEWEFTKEKQYSIVTEFDLVCEREFISFTANSVLFVGWTIGGFILPYFSDRFGRKRILFPSVFTIITTAALSSLAENIWVFILSRFIIGLCQGGCINVFILATELVGEKHRSLSGTIIWFYFTAALLLMTLKAYLLQNWRHLEWACSLPFVVIMLNWSYIPESVRWLRMKGRLEEAMDIFKEIARVNGKTLSNEEILPPESNGDKSKSTITDVMKHSALTVGLFIQILAWFISGITFYGVSLSSSDLGGDLYGDFALTSLVELPANVLVIMLCEKSGRRITTVMSLLLAGLACIGVSIVPLNLANKGFKYVRVSLGMLGKFAATLYFNAFYVWSAELAATVVRAQTMGILVAASRLGAAFSPFIMTGLKYIHPAVPFALVGALNLIAGLFSLKLNETKGRPVPDTIQDCLEMINEKDGLSQLGTSFGFDTPNKKSDGKVTTKGKVNDSFDLS